MKKVCAVCKCDISHRGNRSIRCTACEKTYRKWYRKEWNHSKNITKLGGKLITLKEIRNYKGGTTPDRCFTKNNEVDNEND